MRFSTEELDFFSNIFTESSIDSITSDSPLERSERSHKLSLKTELPPYLKQVLVGSKLTLLAEISHYQLWFPITLSFIEEGGFSPEIGIPEIMDIQGHERSWRVQTPENVAIIDVLNGQRIEVLSLSTTGIMLKMSNTSESEIDLQRSSFEMRLAGGEPLKLELDFVRHEKNIVAAKFKNLQQGSESLRQFLFNSHKIKYANLYQDVIL
ncbi:MAG: hypothetical protein V5789_09340 [Colwellia sp.]